MPSRKERLAAQIDTFVQQYRRPKRPGKGEPNDRQYDRQVEEAVKRMDPQELDALLQGDADESGGERHGSRPGEGASELREDREVGMEPNPVQPSHPER